jgi:hypothetical protein
MKFIWLLFIPFILFSQTYIHNIPCTDNAANTVVTNNGTSANWVAGVNTADLNHPNCSVSFAINTNNEYIISADSLTIQYMEISWTSRFISATAGTEQYYFCYGDNDGTPNENNEFAIRRIAAEADFEIIYKDNVGTAYRYIWTGMVTDNTACHAYVFTIDMRVSPWVVTLTDDGVSITGAWNVNPPALTPNNKISLGYNGILEPDSYFTDFKLRELSDDQIGYPKYSNKPIYRGYK